MRTFREPSVSGRAPSVGHAGSEDCKFARKDGCLPTLVVRYITLPLPTHTFTHTISLKDHTHTHITTHTISHQWCLNRRECSRLEYKHCLNNFNKSTQHSYVLFFQVSDGFNWHSNFEHVLALKQINKYTFREPDNTEMQRELQS